MNRACELVVCAACLPFAVVVGAVAAVMLRLASDGPVFFVQIRVGRGGKLFRLFKLRTMVSGPEAERSSLTVAGDSRLSRSGRVIHRLGIDELPQLWNVLRGDMSLIGPRPEVPEFVDQSRPAWREILSVRPGLTDAASVAFFRAERTLLARSRDRRRAYVEAILPAKLELSRKALRRRSVASDVVVVGQTLAMLTAVGRRREHPAVAAASAAIDCMDGEVSHAVESRRGSGLAGQGASDL